MPETKLDKSPLNNLTITVDPDTRAVHRGKRKRYTTFMHTKKKYKQKFQEIRYAKINLTMTMLSVNANGKKYFEVVTSNILFS